jgi:hypothetical protein
MGATNDPSVRLSGRRPGFVISSRAEKSITCTLALLGVVAMSDRIDDPLETFRGVSDGVRADGAVG